ncbi:ABC transporter permease [Gracilibacillus kekensis]|uniref:ABC-2 type transport system permease protein n=1 Tax=Gracilibacillus kekensis TaxID=1027249 RepID=A0A1M7QDA6_9BACI|nr:ABC transporter permease subunit [Gracilibacillus kekensis]SHN28437.1 ABC-2 type transport system permease protein [Gracilibacillus kekensis]
MQWITIFKKEILEDWRNYKWIWVPLVFIVICIMDPISTYYLPQILESVGGMPEGTVLEPPEVVPSQAIMMSLTELSMLGVLVIVAISMSVIAGERKSGVAELILVKPVSYFTYISAKWAEKLLLVFTSYLIGMLASWYYVDLLFGQITAGQFFSLFFFYLIWLIFVISLTIFYNTIVKVPGLVLTLTVVTIMAMSAINQIFSYRMPWFPNSISGHITKMLMENSVPNALWGAVSITIILSVGLLIASNFILKTKEMAD